jgi:hypothetical protein
MEIDMSSEVSRSTIEALIWQLTGWRGTAAQMKQLLDEIDRYAAGRTGVRSKTPGLTLENAPTLVAALLGGNPTRDELLTLFAGSYQDTVSKQTEALLSQLGDAQDIIDHCKADIAQKTAAIEALTKTVKAGQQSAAEAGIRIGELTEDKRRLELQVGNLQQQTEAVQAEALHQIELREQTIAQLEHDAVEQKANFREQRAAVWMRDQGKEYDQLRAEYADAMERIGTLKERLRAGGQSSAGPQAAGVRTVSLQLDVTVPAGTRLQVVPSDPPQAPCDPDAATAQAPQPRTGSAVLPPAPPTRPADVPMRGEQPKCYPGDEAEPHWCKVCRHFKVRGDHQHDYSLWSGRMSKCRACAAKIRHGEL